MKRVDTEAVWQEAGPLFATALQGSDDTVEELRRACDSGSACLLADEMAFCVLTLVPQALGTDLLIWAVAAREASCGLRQRVPQFEALARHLGARRLLFRTAPRRAYERLMPEGWLVRQVIWAKEV